MVVPFALPMYSVNSQGCCKIARTGSTFRVTLCNDLYNFELTLSNDFGVYIQEDVAVCLQLILSTYGRTK